VIGAAGSVVSATDLCSEVRQDSNNNDEAVSWAGDQLSEWGGSTEELDLKKYRAKIQRVRELMQLPVLEATDDGNVAISVDPEPRKVKQVLPAPPKVITLFDSFMQEVRGTSKKSKKSKPLDFHHFPSSFAPKMSHYEVEDCGWSSRALETDPNIFQSALYRDKDQPPFKVRIQKVMDWETSNRQSLSVASYTDSFLWAGKTKIKELREKLDSRRFVENSSLDKDQLADLDFDAEEAMDCLQSAAKGLQDLMKMTVDRLGSQALVRRDAWLGHFNDALPKAQKLELRRLDISGKYLFGMEEVEKAKLSVKAEKTDLMQDKLLKSQLSVRSSDKKSSSAPSSSKGSGYSQGSRSSQSFRPQSGQRGNRGGARGSSGQDLWRRQSDTPRFDYNRRGRGDRGNRGSFRGSRGGR
jgi:hypothetical protein